MIKRKHLWDNVLTVIMTLLCLLWVYPIALIFINSLKKEGTFTTSTVFALPTKETFVALENYTYGIFKMNFLSSLGYSLLITLTSVALILLCCSMTGWYLTRVNNKLSKFMNLLIVFSMVVPSLLIAEAANHMSVSYRVKLRALLTAAFGGIVAASTEAASLGQVQQVRYHAADAVEPIHLIIHSWDGFQQALGIGMAGVPEQLKGLGLLHDLAGIHNVDNIAHLRHNAHVMGNHQNGGAVVIPELFHELQNLRLNGNVQRGGRLVGDQQLRLTYHGHTDHDALTKSAGKLMRIRMIALLRLGNADLPEDVNDLVFGLFLADILVQQDGLPHLLAHGINGVQGRHRLLKNHGDLIAPDAAHFLFRRLQQIAAHKHHLAVHNLAGLFHQLHHAHGSHTFSAAAQISAYSASYNRGLF